jgi:hypothetical protein
VEGFEFMISQGDAVLVVQALGKYVYKVFLGAVFGDMFTGEYESTLG